jgi:hypothetical protein
MFCNEGEIAVCSEERQFIANAQLGDHGVDRADLNAGAATEIAEIGRFNMIAAVRRNQGDGAEAIDDFAMSARAGKALQQFLKDEPGGDDVCAIGERELESRDFWYGRWGVASEGQRPDTGVHKEGQLRDRSAL